MSHAIIRKISQLCLCCLCLAFSQGFGQSTTTLSGLVVDRSTGQALPGVTVLVKASTNGTVTDANGRFNISALTKNTTLVFSYIGFATQEVVVGTQQNLTVSLETDQKQLSEIVVVGYGEQKKATLTGAVSQIKGEEIIKSPQPNVSNSLVGRIPGLIAQQTGGGEPGNDGSRFFIRGLATTGDASPLIVIDGVANRPGGLDRLNANDIESVTVLKDASAAIYGAQAANGVILVTTKRGKTGEPTISFSYNAGFSSPSRIPRVTNAPTFAQIQNELNAYAGADPRWTKEEIQKFNDGSDPINYPNTSWHTLALKPRGALTAKYNLSLSGGTDKLTYYISLGHINQDGNFKNSPLGYKQYNVASNIDIQATKRLRVSLDLNARQEYRQNSGIDALAIWQGLYKSRPTVLAVLPDGKPSNSATGSANPVAAATDAYGLAHNTSNVLLSTLKFKYDLPVSGLSLGGFAAYDLTSYRAKAFLKAYQEFTLNPNGTSSPSFRANRSLNEGYSGNNSLTLNLRLNFERIVGKHSINSFVAYEQAAYNEDNFGASRRSGFLSDNPLLANLDLGGQPGQNLYGSVNPPATRQNYFGRIAYAYNDRYLLEVTGRYDGSYRFGPGNQFGFFPGISAGWRLSEEDFIKNNIRAISNLKLRASYGSLGNNSIDPFQYTSLYSIGAGQVFGPDLVRSIGVTPGVYPNAKVTWEKAKNYNVAIDVGLFNDKLTFTAEWFLQKRSDLLAQRNLTVPSYTGLVLPVENIGRTQNTGIELQAGYRNSSRAVKYSINGNLVYAKNKVLYIDEPEASATYPEYQRLTGHTIGSGRAYIADGIYKSQAEIDNAPHVDGAIPGDIRLVDYNKDGVIDNLDQVAYDGLDVPQITFGLNSAISYGGFDLSILFQGQSRAKHYFSWDTSPGQNYFQSFAEGRWSPENPTFDKVRAFSGGINASYSSTYFLKDASFVRLKNIELGYSVPGALLSRVKLNALRFYVNGLNLYTLTNYEPSVDPEISEFAGARYPLQKIINVGAVITLK